MFVDQFVKQVGGNVIKGSADQPRDEHGRFSGGGAASVDSKSMTHHENGYNTTVYNHSDKTSTIIRHNTGNGEVEVEHISAAGNGSTKEFSSTKEASAYLQDRKGINHQF